jgi:hypothetical protein
VLRITGVKIPSAYVNVPVNITVQVLYTGTTSQPLSFSLAPSLGVSISNPNKTVEASPNEIFSEKFIVTSDSAGTIPLMLLISTKEANLTYEIPLLVLGGSAPTTTLQGTIGGVTEGIGAAIAQAFKSYGGYIVAGAVILMLLIIARTLMIRQGRGGREGYNRDRTERLIRIREQIKRGGI